MKRDDESCSCIKNISPWTGAALRGSLTGNRPFPRGVSSAKKIAIIKAIAVHAAVAAHQDQSQEKPLNFAASSMAVYIEAAAPGALTNAGQWIPHRCHVAE
jgi:hypothetical protein